MQSNSAPPSFLFSAWILLVVSLALPAITVTGCGNNPPQTLPGWQVATSCAMSAVDTAREAGDLVSQGRQATFEDYRSLMADILAAICFNLPNCLMLFSPFLLWRQQRDRGVWGHYLMGLAAIISWSWGLWASESLRIGYYVWSSGITLLSLTRWPSKRMLASLIASAAVAWLVASCL